MEEKEEGKEKEKTMMNRNTNQKVGKLENKVSICTRENSNRSVEGRKNKLISFDAQFYKSCSQFQSRSKLLLIIIDVIGVRKNDEVVKKGRGKEKNKEKRNKKKKKSKKKKKTKKDQ